MSETKLCGVPRIGYGPIQYCCLPLGHTDGDHLFADPTTGKPVAPTRREKDEFTLREAMDVIDKRKGHVCRPQDMVDEGPCPQCAHANDVKNRLLDIITRELPRPGAEGRP